MYNIIKTQFSVPTCDAGLQYQLGRVSDWQTDRDGMVIGWKPPQMPTPNVTQVTGEEIFGE
jgi:hypothetical protein